ncbi:MAG: DUF3841 domain-containing protein [Chloroflexi bacterium]|nr:DUF3841 domain-containing protein [Chloroflexota bacterium]
MYTVQSIQAWRAFLQQRILRCDAERVWHGYRLAYDWMRSQMATRIPGYGGGYPIWGWYQPKEDLRSWRHQWKEPSVLLMVEVPKERVLLSDFDAWHAVLNTGYLPLSDEESEYYENHVLPPGRYAGMPRKYQAIVEASWERIFDLEALSRSPLWTVEGQDPYIQACVEYVELAEVSKAKPFNLARRTLADDNAVAASLSGR